MQPDLDNGQRSKDDIWIISEGRPINLDLSKICREPVTGPVTEYRISDIAAYLLNPNQITLKEKIIGCKVYYRQPRTGMIRRFFGRIISGKDSGAGNEREPEEIISTSQTGAPMFRDRALNAHFIKINELLMPFDPAYKGLKSLDEEKIEDIKAVCEQTGGNRYQLTLQGSLKEKIDYIAKSISKKTRVVINRAYLTNGLFELRGFDFKKFDANNVHRLIKIAQKDRIRYCVLNANFKFLYWINENETVNYIHTFAHSVRTDPGLREALTLCLKGDAQPLKLFFSKQMEQVYSEKFLPITYREVFSTYKIAPDDKEKITGTLNNYQSIVFFNYSPGSEDGRRELITNISVMHDVRALETIKARLPEIYSEINKKAYESDAGKLYLLDSLRGYQNV